jgi:hypothetical protein
MRKMVDLLRPLVAYRVGMTFQEFVENYSSKQAIGNCRKNMEEQNASERMRIKRKREKKR